MHWDEVQEGCLLTTIIPFLGPKKALYESFLLGHCHRQAEQLALCTLLFYT